MRTWRSFRLADADMTSCKCLNPLEKARERSRVVQAAAVRFCAAAVVKMWDYLSDYNVVTMPEVQNIIQKKLKVTPEVCQEVLTGTLDSLGTLQSKDLFREANALSEHKGTRGMGCLDPLVTGEFPASTEHQKLLRHVCQDECQEIVNETLKNILEMNEDVSFRVVPSEESCADRVVRKVEAEILGCCGRSCGWNGRSCTSWPFLDDKVEWLQQCCTEYNVLQNSTRERMCDSVLSPEQVRLVYQFDTRAKKGDVAGAYLGQGPRLLWAKPDQFQKQLKNSKQKPKENEPVTSDFLEKNLDVYKEGLRKGWFREEKDPQERSTSLAELGVGCQDLQKAMQHCSTALPRRRCFQHLRAGRKMAILSQAGSLWPWVPGQHDQPWCQQTQRSCHTWWVPHRVWQLQVDFGQVVKRIFFTYNSSDPPKGKLILDNPVFCFQEKDPCPDDEDFDRKKLNEFDHLKGFTEYIYWSEEAWVEDCRRQ